MKEMLLIEFAFEGAKSDEMFLEKIMLNRL